MNQAIALDEFDFRRSLAFAWRFGFHSQEAAFVGSGLHDGHGYADGGAVGPVVVAGPTCDSADVLYEKRPYDLPISLEIGDKVLIEGTGAYTSTYSSVAFNGIQPLKTYHI